MTVVRINEFQAKEGQGDALLDLLRSALLKVTAPEGLLFHQILQRIDDPTRIVVIELWESVQAHQISANKIPVHVFEKAMRLMADSPKGAYYRSS